jgi:cytochrome c551/c552
MYRGNTMLKNMTTKFVIAALFLISIQGIAAPRSIELPEETAKFKESIHPGYIIAQQKCSICHSADYINLQPSGMNLKQWTAEVTKMQHAYGAPITDDDIKVIGQDLATTYGNKKLAAMTIPVATTTPVASAIDVKTLLANNACLGCHAMSQKIVGPAYHDVAERYRKNPKALETVMANIKAGGTNKWSAVPMPPFPALTDAELKVLAQFVLSQ